MQLEKKLDMHRAIYLLAAEQIIDGQGSLEVINNLEKKAKLQGLHCLAYTIAPLSTDWDALLPSNAFRSGNGPLEALAQAYQHLKTHPLDVITISGKDNLKTGYSRQQRHKLMEIYPGTSLPEAYTRLANDWCRIHQFDKTTFIKLRDSLFKNYYQTYAITSNLLPEKKWFELVTTLFRGVDCANPVMDYDGKVVVATAQAVAKLNLAQRLVEIKGISVQKTKSSGLAGLSEIAGYKHLQRAFLNTCQQAKINFIEQFKNHQAYLEVYTCFPVVPLAFLFASGMAADSAACEAIIKQYPLTFTGGMNLAKGPWNNPVLRAMITLYKKFQQADALLIGGIHGNGGLGEKQGFALLGVESC